MFSLAKEKKRRSNSSVYCWNFVCRCALDLWPASIYFGAILILLVARAFFGLGECHGFKF